LSFFYVFILLPAFAALQGNVNQVDRKESTSIIIKLRKLLEEEKNKAELLRKEIERRMNVKNSAFSTEDSLRLSEMELENEKLREDYLLLRNSIKRGVEHQELEGNFAN
jgi:myosin V